MRGTAATTPRAKKSGSMVSQGRPDGDDRERRAADRQQAVGHLQRPDGGVDDGALEAVMEVRVFEAGQVSTAGGVDDLLGGRAGDHLRQQPLQLVAHDGRDRGHGQTTANKTSRGPSRRSPSWCCRRAACVKSCLPISTCTARPTLPTPWSPTLRTSWPRAAAHTRRKAPRETGQVTRVVLDIGLVQLVEVEAFGACDVFLVGHRVRLATDPRPAPRVRSEQLAANRSGP